MKRNKHTTKFFLTESSHAYVVKYRSSRRADTEKETGSDDVSSGEPGLAGSSSSPVVGDGSHHRGGQGQVCQERDGVMTITSETRTLGRGPVLGDVRRQEGGDGVKNGASGRIGPGRSGRQKKWDLMDRCEN